MKVAIREQVFTGRARVFCAIGSVVAGRQRKGQLLAMIRGRGGRWYPVNSVPIEYAGRMLLLEESRYCLVFSRCCCYATEEPLKKEEDMMIQIKRAWSTVLDKQYPCPQGIMGRIAGELMIYQHGTETAWTVEIADVQPADSVLEIGFGAGKAIALLAEKTSGGSVAGIDRSATMVKRARIRNRQAVKAGRVTLQQGDAGHLPFKEQLFDKVISIHTLYFWSEPAVMLAEILRVLKTGGMCVITFTTGKAEEAGSGSYQTILAEQMLPGMRNMGWTSASIKHGPIARRYKHVAVIGSK